ncbi:disease resistance-like protein DSC1 [Malus domestica]|uniref:disease resistance-like protein DSC1 n=1 Tax=Malus domestica TaxID=3750 RepID=UPI0010AAB497|nr:disease resistance-like protein DSC1 [Malus domestica]XP_028965595.1 disease resistance-like protein DSC1 [Malus domestica]
MASSSSAAAGAISPRRKHDVFLSFRGEDTRDTFTSHLHAALLRKKLDIYIDYKLERGDEIRPALVEAIGKSKLSVIIFSKNYASSTWCLGELLHILGCKEGDGQFVIPIFYDISPADVRKQQGSYAVAFAQLEERFKDCMDKVLEWRDALEKAANLSGFDNSNKAGTEADFVEKVVQVILTKLNCKQSSDSKGLVGIETKIEEIESLLCIDSPDICTVGIWGMGGIGKTTLAGAVFNRLTSKFEASCFLANVREESRKQGPKNLQNILLREILNEKDLTIGTPSIGSKLVRERLSRTRVLIVLDDVNDSEQLELLVGDDVRFGPKSRIIVTTRDRRLLNEMVGEDKIYEVKGLKNDEALQLFQMHAFKNKSPTTEYTEFSRKVIDYIKGVPLALKTLGALFLHCKTEEDWDEELRKLKKFPSEKVQNVLRLSYNGLEENEKECFLDIACFLKGMDVDSAKRMIQLRGFFENGIQVLIDKSLLSISMTNCLEMHDLLQEMGQKIVGEQCTDEPGKRNRLWAPEDVCQVLENNTGTAKVKCIYVDTSSLTRLQLSGSSFQEMRSLRILKIYGSEDFPKFIGFHDAIFGEVYYKIDLSEGLESLPNALWYLYWDRYPLKSLPSKFSPNNLVELRMPYSRLEAPLWNKNQNLGKLKVIDLSYCTHLAEVPDLSRSSKIEHINLSGCIRLERIPSYFKGFDKLTYLHLGHCENLKFFPQMPDNIEFLDLSFTAIEELPASSIQCLLGLTTLKLSYCSRLVSLPESICKLKSLERLDLTDCLEFKYFPEILEPMEHLKFLSLKGTEVEELHSSIGMLIGLQSLILDRCENLQLVPDSINSLKHLKTLSLIGCLSLKNLNLSLSLCSLEVIRLCFCEIPNHLVFLPWLRDLDLGGTNIESLPSSVIQASQLSHLRLNNCTSLRSLPELPVLRYLEANGCESLQTVSRSRTSLTQAWDKYDLFRGSYHFAKCPKLDDKALSNIVSDAHLRIMQVATAPSNFKEVERYKGISSGTSVSIVYEGNELPNWFSHQSEGSSLTIKLPPDWCGTNFLGFALSLVVDQNFGVANVKFGCKCNFRTDNGESREISYPYYVPFNERGYDISRSSHVFVWYGAFAIEEIENFRCSNSFYKLVTKASFDFHFLDHRDRSHKTNFKTCGICLLYAQDAEKLISKCPLFL